MIGKRLGSGLHRAWCFFFKKKSKKPSDGISHIMGSYVPPPAAPLPPAPKSPYSCVATEILKDLAFENYSKWSYKWEKAIISYYCSAQMQGRDYYLVFHRKDYGYKDWKEEGVYTVTMGSLYEFKFSYNESAAISLAFEKIQNHEEEERKQKRIEKEQEKLKNFFPKCFN